MSRKYNRLFFNKITSEINGSFLNQAINKYRTDYRVQHFDTKSHVNAMLYFDFKGLSSLRELVSHISNNWKLKRSINIPSVSQFSRKNAERDYRLFEDLFYHLVNKLQRKHGQIRVRKDLPVLKIIDSTVITLALKLAPQLEFDKTHSAVKISTLFNGMYPEKIKIVKGTVSDKNCIEDFMNDKNAIYIFDRGYFGYRWYDSLSERGIKFITRGYSNMIIQEEKLINSNPHKDIYDSEVILGSTPGGNLSFSKYREIMTFNKDLEEVTFITNIFDIDTKDIMEIYRFRWEIEVFFKWIKQNLRIKRCIGYSENSIKIQIYSALITYLLIYMIKIELNLKKSMLEITRIIRTNILEENFNEIYEFLTTG